MCCRDSADVPRDKTSVYELTGKASKLEKGRGGVGLGRVKERFEERKGI